MQNTVARKLKQVPEGYLVIGVDPHKKRHAAAAITQDFTTQAKFKSLPSRLRFKVNWLMGRNGSPLLSRK